jgi:acetyl-CoA C-acetyltransferase
MNSIASMADKLRAAPGTFGLVTANGGYLTKHSAGIYSTEAPAPAVGAVPWVRTDPATYQSRIEATAHPRVEAAPAGAATIETYTVTFGREGTPEVGIVVGRLDDGARFCAHVPQDPTLLDAMTREDFLGVAGTVQSGSPVNRFAPKG